MCGLLYTLWISVSMSLPQWAPSQTTLSRSTSPAEAYFPFYQLIYFHLADSSNILLIYSSLLFIWWLLTNVCVVKGRDFVCCDHWCHTGSSLSFALCALHLIVSFPLPHGWQHSESTQQLLHYPGARMRMLDRFTVKMQHNRENFVFNLLSFKGLSVIAA